MNFHPHNFTFAGRLILLGALLIVLGGTAALFLWVNEVLPAGRLPLFLFAIPPLFVAGVFVAIGMLLLRLLGLEFYNPSQKEAE